MTSDMDYLHVIGVQQEQLKIAVEALGFIEFENRNGSIGKFARKALEKIRKEGQ